MQRIEAKEGETSVRGSRVDSGDERKRVSGYPISSRARVGRFKLKSISSSPAPNFFHPYDF